MWLCVLHQNFAIIWRLPGYCGLGRTTIEHASKSILYDLPGPIRAYGCRLDALMSAQTLIQSLRGFIPNAKIKAPGTVIPGYYK